MVAPAGDQGDSPADAHAPKRSPVGQFQCHRQFIRRMEGHSVFHRPVGNTALPGQDGTVCYEGGQLQPGQLLPDEMLVLRQSDDPC